MKQEVELKFKLSPENNSKLTEWLDQHAKFEHNESHLEYYLNLPEKNFKIHRQDGLIDADDYLRVRFNKGKVGSVCLKHWIEKEPGTGIYTHCDEYEYEVSDADEALAMFTKLGYESTKVQKKRTKYTYNQFEIVIDQVEGLGDFIEIENRAPKAQVQESIKEIYDLLRQIEITEVSLQKRGYVSMLWNPDYSFDIVRQV